MSLDTPDPKSTNPNLTNKQQSDQATQTRGDELIMKLFKKRLPIVLDPLLLENPAMQVEKPTDSPKQTENQNPMEHISRLSEAQLEMLKGLDS